MLKKPTTFLKKNSFKKNNCIHTNQDSIKKKKTPHTLHTPQT